MITRGFSLIEMMMVVATISVVAALAVPQLLPEVHKAHLDGASEATAAFLARARNEAMWSKRCVRVWIDANDARRIVSEKLNTFDCDDRPGTFPPAFGGNGLDGTSNVWVRLGELRIDARGVSVALARAPADTSACAVTTGSVANTPAGFPCAHVVFRPNGRTWTDDAVIDDDAVFRVEHATLGADDGVNVLVNSNGLICVHQRGAPLIERAPGDFACPL